jgi:hypothetical protein
LLRASTAATEMVGRWKSRPTYITSDFRFENRQPRRSEMTGEGRLPYGLSQGYS